MDTKETRVEILNGYVLIAVKLPEHTCAVCKRIWTPPTLAEEIKQALEQSYSIDIAFRAPWCQSDADNWVVVHVDNRHALVCNVCGAGVKAARKAREDAEIAAQRDVMKAVR